MVVDINVLLGRINEMVDKAREQDKPQYICGLKMAEEMAHQMLKDAPPQWIYGDPIGDKKLLAVVWDGKNTALDVYDPMRARMTCRIDQNDKMVPASGWQITEQVICWMPVKTED